MDFSIRSYQKELLDGENIPFPDIKKNLQELETVNKYLGGHRLTVRGIKALLPRSGFQSNSPLTVCEMGCGGGDNLRAVQKWCSSKGIASQLIGIDINKECIEYARENFGPADATWITSDYRLVSFDRKPDIIFSSLFCHHFSDQDLRHQFTWLMENSRLGFFINDLHRHPLAYYGIRWLTKIFSASYLVKNDAPLSVLRGFKKNELTGLFGTLTDQPIHISWHWAFRWLLIVKK